MSSDTDTVKCPVLRDITQFPLWQIRLVSKFDAAGVSSFAAGEVVHYASRVGNSISASIYSSIGTHVSVSRNTWEARDKKALSIIQDHISDALIIKFHTLKMSVTLMAAILLKFKGMNTGPRAFLALKRMVDCK
ncbi:hypothetical protein FIBSPDRAFT_730364 [Athelia psychrophila]|uniref:Uncharacterized protein n=1 Tax=Athelia psychrophila TaxID=1759441 RepID=A0A166QZ91_9AGAM|nr:hypothetical protein FIBSPDRAFT_730364 [Fibularhizoctonia sp. CBS 109695]